MAKRDAKLLAFYLEADSTVPMRVSSGSYPRSIECVRSLLSRGLDPNRSDWLGRTFLLFCAANGDSSIASLFLKAGADINARDLESNATPLAWAKRSGRGAIVKLLKQHGANNVN